MISVIHTVSPPRAPAFRERDAVCIDVPTVAKAARTRRQSAHDPRDRLAQMNYFAQSIAQASPPLQSPMLMPFAYHPLRAGAPGPSLDLRV